MKQYIYVASRGEMPIESFSMMGVSTKRDDEETIGMFGTGLKYSISVLLKNNINFFIATGGERVEFCTKEISVKGETFNQVRYRKGDMKRWKDLGFSAEMGLQWGLKDALREIVSNAIDEGDCIIDDKPVNPGGRTVIVIEETTEVGEYFSNIDEYFLLNRKPLFKLGELGEAYECEGFGTKIYHKGVLVYSDNTESLYNYNLNMLEVDERRKADNYDSRYALSKAILHADEEDLKYILSRVREDYSLFEHDLGGCFSISDNARETLNHIIPKDTVIINEETAHAYSKQLADVSTCIVPHGWVHMIRYNNIGTSIDSFLTEEQKHCPDGYELSEYDTLLFESAKDFLIECGYPLEDIKFHFFTTNRDQLGRMFNGQIWISNLAFRNGKKDMVDTILHEYLHAVSGQDDQTREFERYIISEIVKQLELRTKTIL